VLTNDKQLEQKEIPPHSRLKIGSNGIIEKQFDPT
jgi:hypothetical protein